MVFPSVPLYLDPPTTTSWSQQQQQQVQLQQQQPSVIPNDPSQQRPQHRADASGNAGQPRPNSTAERARLAKIPQPEQALKCPRCESTNTKFCYFNNYSLSQPRHFCKTCRRYWTRGGALRNVPVGGGCRRNKRSSSKSSAPGASSSSSAAASKEAAAAASAGPTSLPALPFGMQPLHPMVDYGGPPLPNLGLGFSGVQGMDSGSAASNSMGLEQWRVSQIQQQFPFLGGMESQLQPAAAAAAATQGMYSFDGQPTGSELITQMASVKVEDGSSTRGLNLARQCLGGGGGGVHSRAGGELQFWGGGGGNGGEGSSGGGGGWMTNLSGFNSSSTGSLL